MTLSANQSIFDNLSIDSDVVVPCCVVAGLDLRLAVVSCTTLGFKSPSDSAPRDFLHFISWKPQR